MLARSGPGVARSSLVPTSVAVPVPGRDEEEEPKVASLSEAAGLLKEAVFGDAKPGINWWQPPAAVALGAGGAYGGWKLIDALMDWRRKKELHGEVSDAQQEYEDALQQQYTSALKTAEDSPYNELEDVFELYYEPLEKQADLTRSWWYPEMLRPENIKANMPDWVPNWQQTKQTVGDAAHTGLGALLTAMGITGAAGAMGGWHLARRGSKGKATEEAMKLRRAMRRAPQPIYAYPTEVEEEEEIA